MSLNMYGVYLIPPPPLVYHLSLAHQVLLAEFNTRIAGKFMVQCTIKGFTKLAAGASPDDFLPALDDLFAHTPAFPAHIAPPWSAHTGPGASSILLWLDKTDALQKLHDDVWHILAPYIAPDCPFTPNEPSGPNFPPHITLVQADLPLEPGLFYQGIALAQYIYDTLPTHTFTAEDMQLIEFHSGDWNGAWWETLRYRQLKGWQLPTG